MAFFRKVVIALFAIVVCLSPLETEAALVAKSIRHSNSPEKFRIVVDLNEKINLKTTTGFGNRIVVDLGAGTFDKEVKDLIIANQIVRQAKLFVVGKDKLQLDVLLSSETDYKVYLLENPWRLVIDVFKDYDIKEEANIAPGLQYTLNRKMQSGRALRIHYLTIDPTKWQVKPVLANGTIFSREGLRSMSMRSKAQAIVNASYFGSDGWVIGNLKIDGEVVGMESKVRTALLIHEDNKMEFMMTSYSGQVILPDGTTLPITGVNRERNVNDLIVYESKYADRTRTNPHGREVTIDKDGKILFINFAGNSYLHDGQMVLSGHGIMADRLAQLQVGDRVIVKQSMGDDADKALHVLGVGPRLIQSGNIVLGNGNREQFLPDIMNGRAPRTAVGLTKDGKIILMVVDGRSSLSSGFTLLELANELRSKGVVDAMNFDGGGSSEMVVGNVIKNSPSDNNERRVSVGLGVFPRK